MFTYRIDFLFWHDDIQSDDGHQFCKELADRLAKRASRKQLGDRFNRVVTVVDSTGYPIAAEFEFTGSNRHAADRDCLALMRDIAVDLRAERGLAPIQRQRDTIP